MTVVDAIRARAVAFHERPALVKAEHQWSYAQLFDRVDRLSSALSALGVRKSDRVLAVLGNAPEAVECELAVLQAGIVWITLNDRLTWAEVRGVVEACQPKLILVNAQTERKIVEGSRQMPLRRLPLLVSTGMESDQGDGSFGSPFSYQALLRAHSPVRPSVAVADEDAARLRYTSGTTGTAKAAVLPHRVYQASLDNLLRELAPFDGSERTLHTAPLTHGSGALVYPTLYVGGVNVLLDHFEPETVLEVVERQRITAMFTVPTMLTRLLAAPSFAKRNLSSLRSLIYGGAPMPESQLIGAVEKVGHALMHIYGMTEAPWPITTLRQPEHRLDNPRLRSIGRPTSSCELRIVDEAGQALGSDQIGEIQIKGRNVMSGYYQDAQATAEVLQHGWLKSGDLGRRDADGYYYIVDRKKDVIISGGFNVYAKEVEMALCEDARILEAAVIGLPHADWGELVAAFVVARPGVDLCSQEVDVFARRRLSGYKCPRRIQVVSELPKNASGKVLKSELRRSLASQAS